MLDVQNLSNSFSGIAAVRDVTFQARHGEATASAFLSGILAITTVLLAIVSCAAGPRRSPSSFRRPPTS